MSDIKQQRQKIKEQLAKALIKRIDNVALTTDQRDSINEIINTTMLKDLKFFDETEQPKDNE